MNFGEFRLSENKLKLFNEINASEITYRLVFPADIQLKPNYVPVNKPLNNTHDVINNKRRRRGRPRKGENRPSSVNKMIENETNELLNEDPNTLARTRCGRVTRPPKHMSKFIDIQESPAVIKDGLNLENSDFMDIDRETMNSSNDEMKKGRKNLAHITCHVCKKVYLGQKRIRKHWNAFPSHRTEQDHDTSDINSFTVSKSNLFNELVSRLDKIDGQQRNEYLLTELTNFTTELNKLKEHILKPMTASNQREYTIKDNVSQLLGVTEGNYVLNENFLENYKSSVTSASNTSQEFNAGNNDISKVELDHISDNAVESTSMETFFENNTQNNNSTSLFIL